MTRTRTETTVTKLHTHTSGIKLINIIGANFFCFYYISVHSFQYTSMHHCPLCNGSNNYVVNYDVVTEVNASVTWINYW
jgi:hypothetical protein